MAKDKNKKVKDFVDDGRTIANMDFDSMGNYSRRNKKQVNYKEKRQEISELNITGKERWAIIKALYMKLIPFVVIMFVVFFLVFFILISLWT